MVLQQEALTRLLVGKEIFRKEEFLGKVREVDRERKTVEPDDGGEASMEKIIYSPIGIIHTPFKYLKGIPNQPAKGKDVRGVIEILPEYVEGLKKLDGFSHIILVYHFHLSKGYSLKLKPYMHDSLRGLFATRSPKRPNPIGISIVRLVKIDGATIHVKDLDIMDGTPLLDIKPYVPEDSLKPERIGWLSERTKESRKGKDSKWGTGDLEDSDAEIFKHLPIPEE